MLFLHERTAVVVGKIVAIEKPIANRTFFWISGYSHYSVRDSNCYNCFHYGGIVSWYRSKDIIGILENVDWVHGNFYFYRGF